MRPTLAIAALLALSSPAAADEPDPKPCDKDGKACFAIGDQYARGEGTAKDEAKALAFYLKACDKRVPRGCGVAASMTLFGPRRTTSAATRCA